MKNDNNNNLPKVMDVVSILESTYSLVTAIASNDLIGCGIHGGKLAISGFLAIKSIWFKPKVDNDDDNDDGAPSA